MPMGAPLDLECRALRAAVGHAAGLDHLASLPAQLRHVNWAWILWLGRGHRALVHLLAAVETTRADIPAAALASLRQFRFATATDRLARTAELLRLQREFDRCGLIVASASGWALGERYPTSSTLRPLGATLRYVIRSSMHDRGAHLLRELGYTVGAGHVLDLRTAQSRITLDIEDDDDVWARSERVTLSGVPLRLLSAADWLRRLCRSRHRSARPLALYEALDVLTLGRAAGVGDGVTLPSGDPVVADAWQFSHELLQKSDADDCPSEYPWRSIMRGADPAPGTWSSLGRYAPSPMSVVDQMLAFAEIDASDVVVDLGSGDGRLVIRAAEAYGVRGVGIDQEPALIAASIAASERAGVADRVTFTQADLMTADLSGATVIFLYLQGSFYGALGRRLRSHLRPGVRVVSHNVGFPDWLPTKTAIVAGGTNRAVFLYLWTIEDGSVSLLEPADATG